MGHAATKADRRRWWDGEGMTTLTEFLLARIKEDKAAATAAIGHQVTIGTDWADVSVQHHIARWSSARVLAECETKRRIVEYAAKVDMPPNEYLSGWDTACFFIIKELV